MKAKSIKATCLSTYVGGDHSKLTSAGKCSVDGKYLITIITSAVAKALNMKKSLKGNLSTTQTRTPSMSISTLKRYKLVRIPTCIHTMAVGND